MKRAIFLDRDGTIIADKGFVHKKEDVELLPKAAEAIKLANEHNFLVIVVTNQSGVARGYFKEDDVKQLHEYLNQILQTKGARIDAFYYCPHHPDASVKTYKKACFCRKPEPGLLLKAADDFGINLSESYMIGDSQRDIEAGKKAGCKTILLKTEAKDLLEAVKIIVSSG